MSATVRTRGSARWSRLLTWHLAVVAVATVALVVSALLQLDGLATAVSALTSLLGLPWSTVLPFAYVDLGPVDWLWSAAAFAPALVNVVLHQRLLVWLRARDQRDLAPATSTTSTGASGSTGSSAAPPNTPGVPGSADARVAAWVVAFGGCALVGAAIWGAWLGWDPTYYTTADSPEPQGPYTPAQVVACAVSVALVTAALSRWRNPVVVAAGITFGFWVPWTALAAAGPSSGSLWAVGSALLLSGLVAGTVVMAVAGYASRRWRTPSPAQPAPGLPGQWRRTATALVVVGGCWLLVGAVVRLVLPLAWTYLTILHVPLDLVAVAAVTTGVVLAVLSVRRRRAVGLGLRPLAPSAALIAVLLVAVVTARAVPAGDGYDGQVGVMAGPDGSPVAVLGLCRGTADSLVVLDLESDLSEKSWEERGEEAQAAALDHDGGLDGVVQVDLADPPAGWEGSALGAPASGEDELNITATGRGSLLNDTYFTRAEVADLAPGMVTFSVWDKPDGAYRGNEQAPLADFDAVACSDRGRYP